MADQVAPNTIIHGQTVIAVINTEVTLGLGTRIRSVVVRAHATNTQNIYVGATGVTAANGYILAPGESVSLAIRLRSTVFINGGVVGEGVSYIAVI